MTKALLGIAVSAAPLACVDRPLQFTECHLVILIPRDFLFGGTDNQSNWTFELALGAFLQVLSGDDATNVTIGPEALLSADGSAGD
jgi:hypothetical protein